MPSQHLGERARAEQAARMGGKDSLFRSLHHADPRAGASPFIDAGGPTTHLPVKRGLRFSANAVAASRWSSVVNDTISYAIEASRIMLSCCLSHLLTASLVHRIEIGRAQRLNSSHMSISYAVFCLK